MNRKTVAAFGVLEISEIVWMVPHSEALCDHRSRIVGKGLVISIVIVSLNLRILPHFKCHIGKVFYFILVLHLKLSSVYG